MSSPSPAPQSSVPQPLQDALDAHYRTLLAETQQIQLSSLSSSSTKLPASHSPRSTASTASSDLSPSLSPPSSPHRSPHSKRERVLTSLDDGDDPDAFSSPTASVLSHSVLVVHVLALLPSASPPVRARPLGASHTADAHGAGGLAGAPLHSRAVPPAGSHDHSPAPARGDRAAGQRAPRDLLHRCTSSPALCADRESAALSVCCGQLLYLVIMRSALTPSLCKLFAASGHDSVVEWVDANIDLSALLIASTQSCRERF